MFPFGSITKVACTVESASYVIEDGWRIYPIVYNVDIGSDNGLSPERHQAIIEANADLLSIESLGTAFNQILIKIRTFSMKKMCLKYRL